MIHLERVYVILCFTPLILSAVNWCAMSIAGHGNRNEDVYMYVSAWFYSCAIPVLVLALNSVKRIEAEWKAEPTVDDEPPVTPQSKAWHEQTIERHRFWLDYLKSSSFNEYVYLIRDVTLTGTYKIGRTNNPRRRMHEFKTQLPFKVHIIHLIPTKASNMIEEDLHYLFKKERLGGEWFALTDKDVSLIIENYDWWRP